MLLIYVVPRDCQKVNLLSPLEQDITDLLRKCVVFCKIRLLLATFVSRLQNRLNFT